MINVFQKSRWFALREMDSGRKENSRGSGNRGERPFREFWGERGPIGPEPESPTRDHSTTCSLLSSARSLEGAMSVTLNLTERRVAIHCANDAGS